MNRWQRRRVRGGRCGGRRERGAEVDPGAGARLREAEFGGVEEIAARAAGESSLLTCELRSGAVERVADDGMMERGEVDADLVGAAGVELDFEERGWADAGEDAPVGAGFAGAGE